MPAVMTGKVFLLGAGPGDPELITRRAARYLGLADVVLYDALVHPDVLRHCRIDAELHFVGKRAGRASERQSQINERLLEESRRGRIVARVKGGDPFLFGRGSEEAEALAAAGVPFEVVPGVPSAHAAAAYAGLSLTHRDLASSVAYLTATESPNKDRTSHDWARLATATQTLVIFMGLRKLETLMALLVEHGRPPTTPVAVIQSASLPSQRTVVGTVADIAERARAAGLGMPALTIVGEVVRLREHLRWYDTAPLFGQRVIVTRPSGQAEVLSQMLRDRGAEPLLAPTIRIMPPTDGGPLAKAVSRAREYDWILFTSQNGVAAFFAELIRQGGDARRLGGAKVASIGPGTAKALESHGVRADLVPAEFRGEALAEAIVTAAGGTLAGKKILLARAKVAREVLPDMLRTAAAEVDVVEAYRSDPPDEAGIARLADLVNGGEVDIVTFTASSTVSNMVTMLGDSAQASLARLVIASIGPITTKTAEDLGVRVDVTAQTYTNEGLVQALTDHMAKRPGRDDSTEQSA